MEQNIIIDGRWFALILTSFILFIIWSFKIYNLWLENKSLRRKLGYEEPRRNYVFRSSLNIIISVLTALKTFLGED